jgi:hypothetical protein
MSPYQFWHEEESLIYAYQKAYERNVYKQSHIIGAYVFEAVSLALNNAFADKKSKQKQFPNEIYDPFNPKNIEEIKPIKNKDNIYKNLEFWAGFNGKNNTK